MEPPGAFHVDEGHQAAYVYGRLNELWHQAVAVLKREPQQLELANHASRMLREEATKNRRSGIAEVSVVPVPQKTVHTWIRKKTRPQNLDHLWAVGAALADWAEVSAPAREEWSGLRDADDRALPWTGVNAGEVIRQRYPSLADAYTGAGGVFGLIDRISYHRRGWLHTAVTKFTSGQRSGYFFIEAKAGYGKTVLAAGLAREGKCPHHFVGATSAGKSSRHARRSLAAQLIAQSEEPYSPRALAMHGGCCPSRARGGRSQK